MKYAADFRYIAREALRGKWLIAVLSAFVASLIGAQIASGGGGMGKTNEKLQPSCPGAKLMDGKVWKKNAKADELAAWAAGMTN